MGVDFLGDAELRKQIVKHLDEETYRFSDHSIEEMHEDHFDFHDIIYVLRYGTHARDKDTLKIDHWRYAIEGRAQNGKRARVIVKLQKELLIITVFKI